MTPPDFPSDFLTEDFLLGELDDRALSRLEAAIRQQPELADEMLSASMAIDSIRRNGMPAREAEVAFPNIVLASSGWRSVSVLALVAAASVLLVTMWPMSRPSESDETLQIAQAWVEQTAIMAANVNPSIAPETNESELNEADEMGSIADDGSFDWILVAVQLDAPEENDG